jgi:hypothetical protein
VADEIVQIVRVLDGLNRVRFEHDAELMAAWESASNVFGGPRVTGGKTDPARFRRRGASNSRRHDGVGS